jgi:hypothetical protein
MNLEKRRGFISLLHNYTHRFSFTLLGMDGLIEYVGGFSGVLSDTRIWSCRFFSLLSFQSNGVLQSITTRMIGHDGGWRLDSRTRSREDMIWPMEFRLLMAHDGLICILKWRSKMGWMV